MTDAFDERYELGPLLGRGGMGAVYRARDRLLGRTVAVKMLSESAALLPVWRERFGREARAMARLSHPNLLSIHDVRLDDDPPAIVLEFVDGPTLGDWLVARQPSLRTIVALLERIARALDVAHAAGVVHRDLKPGNILVETATDQPKVADFGLARIEETRAGPTRTGHVLGTPLYMAPEQIEGRPGDVTPATDVHALGVVLYEAATGQRPYGGRTTIEILAEVREKNPVPPGRLRPAVDRDLERVILRALEKRPADRFATAADLADDLARWLDDQPVLARPVGPLERSRRSLWRHRWPILLLVACLLPAGWLLHASKETSARRTGADSALGSGRRAGAGGSDEATIDPTRTADRSEVQDAIEALRRDLRDAALDPESWRRRLAVTRQRAAEAAHERGDDALAHFLHGQALELEGRDEEASGAYGRTISLDPGFGPAHLRLGRVLLRRAQLATLLIRPEADEAPLQELRHEMEPARRLAEQAEAALRAAGALESGSEDEFDRFLAGAFLAWFDEDDAAFDRLYEEGTRLFSGRDDFADFLSLFFFRGRPEDRRRRIEAALAERPADPYFLFSRALLTESLEGPTDGALADLDRALAQRPRFPAARFVRATVLRRRGEPGAAIDDLDRLLADDPTDAAALAHRAWLRHGRADFAGALEDAGRLAALRRPTLADRTLTCFCHLALGDPGRALVEAESMIELDPASSIALATRGTVRFRLGQRQAALADLDRAVALDPTDGYARHRRAFVRGQLGDTGGSLEDLDVAISVGRDNPATRFLRGMGRWFEDDLEGALDDLDRAADGKPGDPSILVIRGSVRVQAGSIEPGIADLEAALAAAPPGWSQRSTIEDALAEARRRR